MKLAEALQERADLLNNIDQLRRRLNNNALVQEGEEPAEDPGELLAEFDRCIDRLNKLVAAINKTNCVTIVGGKSLTQLISEKDALSAKLSAYRDVAYSCSQATYRARNTEIRIFPTLDVKKLQSEADSMAKQLRLLNNRLQQCNWSAELIED